MHLKKTILTNFVLFLVMSLSVTCLYTYLKVNSATKEVLGRINSQIELLSPILGQYTYDSNLYLIRPILNTLDVPYVKQVYILDKKQSLLYLLKPDQPYVGLNNQACVTSDIEYNSLRVGLIGACIDVPAIRAAVMEKELKYVLLVFLAFIIVFTITSVPLASHLYGMKKLQRQLWNWVSTGDYVNVIKVRGTDFVTRNLISTITHLLKHQEEYQQQRSALEKAELKEKIVTGVAHDIRSPLSSMQAALMMLRKQCSGNKDATEFLNLLQLSSNRLEGISNGLLAKYKGEETGIQKFSIHEVLDELIGELRASPIGKGTEFVKHYHSNALYVSGDKTGVSRAIGNIIKNALEAMQENPVDKPKQLTVTTTSNSPSPQPSPEGEGVLIRITDTGPGIPADKIPLILQGGHTEGKNGGHGIGTKVVREVIDAHKGTLNIESEIGKGTSFIITLPVANIATQDSDVTVTVPYSSSVPIRVIDDEPSMREQWRLTLKALGAEVVTHTCWEDLDSSVASLPQNDKVCTFIVDYHFDNSELDGLEIIRCLKERGFDKFILVTAEYWKPAIKDAAKELNITLCPKPLPRVVLAQHLDSSAVPQNDNGGPSVLLIDDDLGIQTTWKVMKSTLGVSTLTMYSKLEDMIAAATNPADYDMCIIDKNIEGSQYNGAKMLVHLKENGARKVFLATGESRHDIVQDPAFSTIDGIITEKVPMSLGKYLS